MNHAEKKPALPKWPEHPDCKRGKCIWPDCGAWAPASDKPSVDRPAGPGPRDIA